MGAGIHATVETMTVRQRRDGEWYEDWNFLLRAPLPRNYGMFGVLGLPRAGMGGEPFHPRRGVPPDADFEGTLRGEWVLHVWGGLDPTEMPPDNIERKRAEAAVGYGTAAWWYDDNRNYVTNPEYHHPSWAYFHEIEVILAEFEGRRVVWASYAVEDNEEFKRSLPRIAPEATPEQLARLIDLPVATYDLEPEYEALVAYLRVLEGRGVRTRLIFWFDN